MSRSFCRALVLVIALLGALPGAASAALGSGSISRVTLSASAGTDVFSGGGYRYGPSLIINADNSVDMWASSPGSGSSEWDYIRYKHSTDGGLTWGSESIALAPTPGSLDHFSTCDPGVFKSGGYYYIGYTSTTNSAGVDNQVFVARSTDPAGPYEKWNGSGWGGTNPQPIIPYTGDHSRFGAGEPSFVVKDNQIYMYYTWIEGTRQETRLSKAPVGANWPASLSYQGVAVDREGIGNPDGAGGNVIEDSTDIKYVDSLGKFVGVTTANRMLSGSFVKVYESTNGIDFTRSYALRSENLGFIHNIGITGTELGHLDTSKANWIGYAYGSSGGATSWGNWNTRREPITLSASTSGTFANDFNAGVSGWTASAGTWTAASNFYRQTSTAADPGYTTVDNVVFGSADYATDLKINTVTQSLDWAGVQIAKQHPGDSYGASGYTAFIRANGTVSLFKAGQGTVVSDVATGLNPVSAAVRLRVVKAGDTIKVFMNSATTPTIDWTDTGTTWDAGYLGYVTSHSATDFDNVAVTNNVYDTFPDAASWSSYAGTWGVSGGNYNQTSTAADPAGTGTSMFVGQDGDYGINVRINSTTGPLDWAGIQIDKAAPSHRYYDSGYTVFMRASGALNLYRAGQGVVVSDVATGTSPTTGFVHLQVVRQQNNIQVFVNGSKTAAINWSDSSPLAGGGYAGLTSVKSDVSFRDFTANAQTP